MTIEKELNGVLGVRDSNAAIINFWSAAEYTYRVAQEQLQKMNEAKAEVDLPSCPDEIKTHGGGVLAKLQAFVDALAEHEEFLMWKAPKD